MKQRRRKNGSGPQHSVLSPSPMWDVTRWARNKWTQKQSFLEEIATPPLLEITAPTPKSKLLTSLLPKPGKSTILGSNDYDGDREAGTPCDEVSSSIEETVDNCSPTPQTGNHLQEGGSAKLENIVWPRSKGHDTLKQSPVERHEETDCQRISQAKSFCVDISFF